MLSLKEYIEKYLTNKAPEGCDLKVGDLVYVKGIRRKFKFIIVGFNYTDSYSVKYKKYAHVASVDDNNIIKEWAHSFWLPVDHKGLKKIKL
jgi:hypothetical protein